MTRPLCTRRTTPRILLALVLASSGVGTAGAGPVHLQVAADAGTVLCRDVRPGDELEVEFLHSYDRFPVREFYVVLASGNLLASRLVLRSVLNGQGYAHPGFRVREDGWATIEGIDEERRQVEFLMGSPDHANHRLTVRGETIPLARWIESGTLVTIDVASGACP